MPWGDSIPISFDRGSFIHTILLGSGSEKKKRKEVASSFMLYMNPNCEDPKAIEDSWYARDLLFNTAYGPDFEEDLNLRQAGRGA